jgi:hypothetical protein
MLAERLKGPMSASERFTVLRELAALFSAQQSETYGYAPGDIEAARLAMPNLTGGAVGPVLPAALAEWYRSVGRVPELTSSQNSLHAPNALRVQDDVLVIYTENQACAFWGIWIGDLERDDPPVVCTENRDWHAEAETLSEFALTVGLTEVCMSGSRFCCAGYLDDPGLASLRSNMTVLPVRTLRWPPSSPGQFLATDTILAYVLDEFTFAVSTQPRIAERIASLAAPGAIEWTDDGGSQ